MRLGLSVNINQTSNRSLALVGLGHSSSQITQTRQADVIFFPPPRSKLRPHGRHADQDDSIGPSTTTTQTSVLGYTSPQFLPGQQQTCIWTGNHHTYTGASQYPGL